MNNKTTRLYTRITPSEKRKVEALALSCGLSVSEYIRQRCLGFAPRPLQPELFYEMIRRIEGLSEMTGNEGRTEIDLLLGDIRRELILPGKDKEVIKWLPLDSGPSKDS